MCKCLKLAVLLLGCIVFASCASNVTTTVRLGFEHAELVNKVDGTGDNNGWEVGGSVGFAFDESGLSAIEPCVGGGLVFSNMTIGDELKTVASSVPASICTEFDLSLDDDDA